MTRRTYCAVVRADLCRYGDGEGWLALGRHYVLSPGYRYTFWMRTAAFLRSCGPSALPLYAASRLVLRRLKIRFGIDIPYNTIVGPGLYVGHFGGIVVNAHARIGADCNISHGVTVGASYGGRAAGVPEIGDRVYLAPGCKIVGGIRVGNDVAVGANAVVVESIPDRGVAGGVPAKLLSDKGSFDYVINLSTKYRTRIP